MRPLRVTSATVLLVLVSVPAAYADTPHGNFEMSIQGRYDFHIWIWAISGCGDQCAHVQAIPQPVARAFPYRGDAQLAEGRYTLTVDVPDGLRCGNVYYGPVIPTRDVYTWDALSLAGTVSSSFGSGCDGAPGGTFSYPFHLTMM